MPTFLNILNDYDFTNIVGSVSDLRNRYKPISKFINKFYKLRKDEIIECVTNISKYKTESKDTTFKFTGKHYMKPDEEQLLIIKVQSKQLVVQLSTGRSLFM